MSILQAIVLGLVQGATEFAPVSSSGHLILVPWIFGWAAIGDADLQKTFDVALHMGTLIGALIYFRADVTRYAAAWFRSLRARRLTTPDERIAWALFIGLSIISFHFGVEMIMQLDFRVNQLMCLIFLVNVPFWMMWLARGRKAPALGPA